MHSQESFKTDLNQQCFVILELENNTFRLTNLLHFSANLLFAFPPSHKFELEDCQTHDEVSNFVTVLLLIAKD